jgi:hypothetical protein
MKIDTEMWLTNLQWMGFRVFFIECFLRNILFQIHRNSSFYVLLIPPLFPLTLVLMAYAFTISQFKVFDPQSDLYRPDNIGFYLFFAALLLAFYGYLRRSLSFIWESIKERRWSKFHELNVQGSMTRTLDAYVEQLDRWRSVMKSRA